MFLPAKKLSLISALIFCGMHATTFANQVTLPKTALSDSWIKSTLQLQREIDLAAPMNEVTFLATHNSYNSKIYSIPAVRYLNPNQLISLYDQLEAGVRSIELDAHYTFTASGSQEILLCHGNAENKGCGLYDRPIEEGLAEIRDWLEKNPNEIVLLYIERMLSRHEPRLAHSLKTYLGDYIYKASNTRKPDGSLTTACISLPRTLTKNDVLNAGKQLLIITKGCSGPTYEEEDKYKEIWNDDVFAGTGDVPHYPFTLIYTLFENFTPYPDCGISTTFNIDPLHTSLWRVWDDRTIQSNPDKKHKPINPMDMPELLRCGINWPALDMLTPDDPRLAAAIWSWAPDYPRQEGGRCAIYKDSEGFQNIDCDQTIRAYACQDELSRAFKVVRMTGTWQEGERFCQFVAGSDWHFAAPINGAQMNAVKNAASERNVDTVWVNYAMDAEAKWRANEKGSSPDKREKN